MTLCTSSYRRNKAAEALRELVHAHLQRAEVRLWSSCCSLYGLV